MLLKSLHEHLALKGYQIIDAHDGIEGFEAIKREKPDLVILDIKMPNLDGMTMLKMLRQEDLGKTIKVMFLTNLDLDEQMTSKVVEGLPLYYLMKSDTSLEELTKKVEEATQYN